jgi:uncharacterized protein involved in response to NO
VATLPVVSDPKTRQAEFQVGFIWIALATAVFAGFAIGAHLGFVIGFDFPLGRGFASFVQTHGHLQLVGWAGLFIIGISLHVIPRLASVPLARPGWIARILRLMTAGLLLRTLGQPALPYLAGGPAFAVASWVSAASGLLEWVGIVAYVSLLLRTLRGAGDVRMQPALFSVRPFFGMMLTGWILYGSLNLVLLARMAVGGAPVVDQPWNEFAVQLFLGLVLLPVAFGFSVRMFPLYLTLRAPDWPVRGTAYAYLLALCLQLFATAPPLAPAHGEIAGFLSNLGALGRGGIVLWFVWQLDILTRSRQPWTAKREVQPLPDKRPTRTGLPDYGEFGRFERLVYAAYTWLVLAAFFEMLVGAAGVLGFPMPIPTDAVRHLYLLGFITHLIFGVSVRMIPGLLQKKRVASCRLVDATFWLGTAAAVGRVLPLLVPSSLVEALPAMAPIAQTAFAFSGIAGLFAVVCLAINLRKTAVA